MNHDISNGTGEHATRLCLLGGFQLRDEAKSATLSLAEQRLVAFLVVHHAVRRPLVAGTLWPDVSQRRAMGCLRTTLWRLQRRDGSLVVITCGALSLSPAVAVDVDELAAVVDDVIHGRGVDVERLLALGAELLPGWDEHWLVAERAYLQQLWLHAIELAGSRRLSAGDYLAALQAGLEATRVDPWRESAHLLAAQAHRAEGNNMAAVKQIELCRTMLADSGVVASGRLRDLADSLRTRAPAASP